MFLNVTQVMWCGGRGGGMGVLPAVDDHGPHTGKLQLLAVDLRKKTEDFVWLLRDTMIRPAQVLKVPDLSRHLTLKHTHTHITRLYIFCVIISVLLCVVVFYVVVCCCCCIVCYCVVRLNLCAYPIDGLHLHDSNSVVSGISFGQCGHYVLPELFGLVIAGPVWNTLILQSNTQRNSPVTVSQITPYSLLRV